MNKYNLIRLLIFFTLLLVSYNSFSGWIISEKSKDKYGNITIQTITIQNNHIRFDDQSSITVFNLDKQTVIIAFNNKKIYWTGTLQDFRKGVISSFGEQMKYLIEHVSEDQRAYFEDLYQNYLKSVSEQPEKTTPTIRIKKNDSTFVIKGFETKKYKVFVGDTLKELLWITRQINPYSEIDQEKLFSFNNQLSPFDKKNTYSLADEYINLLKQGMPVRSMVYYSGNEEIFTEVEEIQNTDIDPKTFDPPVGFKAVELPVLLNQLNVR